MKNSSVLIIDRSAGRICIVAQTEMSNVGAAAKAEELTSVTELNSRAHGSIRLGKRGTGRPDARLIVIKALEY